LPASDGHFPSRFSTEQATRAGEKNGQYWPTARRGLREPANETRRARPPIGGHRARDAGFDRISAASYGFLNGTPRGFPISKGKNMSWETPSFIEIDMSAEIGSYEGEDYDGL
jgi:coenzyme PQQ precursor peptide PqqA